MRSQEPKTVFYLWRIFIGSVLAGFIITGINVLIIIFSVTDAFFKKAFTGRVSQKYISRILAHRP
jgi:hypothetical protein